jgi:Fe-S-cluster containining protein
MNNTQAIVARVAELYAWVDQEIQDHDAAAGSCLACAQCCDFVAYDHRLYVTTPELIYFKAQLGSEPVKPMSTGRCPYQEGQKCSVHTIRFLGCRIFCCKGQSQFQNELMETALQRLKALCEEFDIPYQYTDLATALNQETQCSK